MCATRSTSVAFLIALAAVALRAPAQTAPAQIAPAATQASADDAEAAKLAWPRTFKDAKGTLVIYQPQIEQWKDNQLSACAAVSVTPAGKTEPSFGVIWMTARTDVDKTDRMVTLDELKITRDAFPQDKNREPEFLEMIRSVVPMEAREIPLDHIEANLAMTAAVEQGNMVPVKNDPPKIIFSWTPSLLVLIDGNPSTVQVAGTSFTRVVNTRALILLDSASGKYFLHAMNRWWNSAAATGPWAAANPPAGADAVADQLSKATTIDLLDPANPEAAPKEPPTIYTSTTPAELIQSVGEPKFSPIPDTNLVYCTNTDSAMFLLLASQEYYVLISGRWFKAKAMAGPWTYVDGKDLPPDFSKIPPDSPKSNVLVSIPGTPQAKEAIIANSIPQTASVSIADTHLTVEYDGQPKFVALEGTQGLQYCTNTALPVMYVPADKSYFCVQNGVWFSAFAPTGPWVVAKAVPGVIYTIPVTSPLHYVTYVKIYGSTDTVVYVGYTPGYMGTCVSNGVVVYGTGYVYPAYVGTTWVGYPPTYGYGAGFACGSMTGFAFGFAAGAMMGDCWSQPYWGPCHGGYYGHVDINTTNVYNNWRGGVSKVNSHYEWDAYNGKFGASQRGATFNPYTGRASVGGYSNYANFDSGNYQFQKGAATYNPNTGVVKGGGVRNSGNMYDGDSSYQTAKFRYNTETDSGVARAGNDVYAGKDGNVYKYNKDSGWQEKTDDGWQATDKPTVDRPNANTNTNANRDFSQQRQNLDQQRTSRDVGSQRYNNYRSSGGYSGGGGGSRGGGGGRGGGRGRR